MSDEEPKQFSKSNLRRLLRQDALVVIDWANIFYAQKSLEREVDVEKLIVN